MIRTSTALAALLVLTGCTVVKDVFKAGMWVGVVAVIVVFALVAGAMSLMKRS